MNVRASGNRRGTTRLDDRQPVWRSRRKTSTSVRTGPDYPREAVASPKGKRCTRSDARHVTASAAKESRRSIRDSSDAIRAPRDFRSATILGWCERSVTTVFDYVRRAMPQMAPGSLTNDQTYALTAYLLAANRVIPMSASLDSASLVAVKMPYADRFVRDDRRGGHEVR